MDAHGQVPRSGGNENSQLAQQYQQALSERTQLQSDNEQLKKQLDGAKQELDATKKKLTASSADANGAQARLNALQASSDSSKKEQEQLRARTQELIARFRETIDQLRGVEVERNKLQGQLAQMTSARDSCADRNVQMFKINAELLDRLQHRGGSQGRVTRAEPFTRRSNGLASDNLVLEDRERIDVLHVQKTGTSGPATPGGSTTPSSAGSGGGPR